MRALRSRVVLAALMIATACTDKTEIVPPKIATPTAAALASQAPGAVTFIAPLGSGVADPSTFDPNAAPTVSICQWSGTGCTGSPVATFTPTANTTAGEYEASWSILSTSLGIRRTYRIRAMVGTTEVGGVLVDVVRGRWGLTRNDGTLATLLAANEIPIRFHIERAAPALTSIAVTLAPSTIVMGQTAQATAQGVDQYGGSIATGPITWSSSDPNAASVNNAGVVTGLLAGAPSIIATAGNVTGQATITVNAPPAIRINEVESNQGVPGDWVELYNTTSAPVDISGWKFRDNDPTHGYVFPSGTVIPAGGFYVIEEAAMDFGLGANEEARLYHTFGALVDMYAWTAHALTTYGRCPDGTGQFQTTAASTKGAANDCGSGGTTIKINEVESNNGTPGDWIELINTGTTPVDISGFIVRDNDDTHGYAIPAGTTLAAGAFYVVEEAAMDFGLGAADAARIYNRTGTLLDSYTWTAHAATTYGRCPNGTGAFTTTTSPTKGASNACGASGATIRVNEVESNGGTPGDWIELYNFGTTAVNIGGFAVKDNDDTRTYTIPAGTMIAAGGYYVVEEAAMDFGLGAADQARVYNGSGVLVDMYEWTAHASTTYGRCPDGTGAFQTTAASTKGAANDCGNSGTTIKINEVESNGGTPGDWIELINTGTTAVNIGGFIVRDNVDGPGHVIPAGTTLAAGAYYIVEEAALGFGLGAADAARLFNTAGTLLDSYVWTAHATTTYGRCPNGTGAFTTTNASTKGAANDCGASGATVKINEVESNNGVPGDWVELYNTGTSAVSLAGFQVRDNDDTHIMTFPAGASIPAGGFLVVDEDQLGYGLGAADAVRLYNASGTIVDTYSWTAHAATTYGRCPDGTGAFQTTSTSTKGGPNDCGVGGTSVKVNEVESDGGSPGDWIELYNTGASPVNIGGFIVRDNDDTHTYTIPAGTSIAAGGFYVVEEAQLGFGLGSADAARLYNATGLLIDSYSWTAHAVSTTYGRCPDGTGAFITTFSVSKGTANVCAAPSLPWPGSNEVRTVDGTNVFTSNMSGLVFESGVGGAPSVLWAAKNGPGTMYRLIFSGGIWTPDPSNGWSAGKALKYTDGTGNPDAEGITFAAGGSAGGMYVSTERNNDISGTSRNVILRFDPSQAGSTLTATHQWDITADIPATGANLGLEAITWIPDSYLTSANFFDESKGHAYVPSEYANHGTGLFFVGVEAPTLNGVVFAYALDHASGGFTKIATITTGFPGVMDLSFDRETNYLWAICDDGCQNTSATFEVNTATGRFGLTRRFARPAGLPANMNNEGFAITTMAECVSGFKPVFWADDAETGGHSIRAGTIPCGALSSATRNPVVRAISPIRRP